MPPTTPYVRPILRARRAAPPCPARHRPAPAGALLRSAARWAARGLALPLALLVLTAVIGSLDAAAAVVRPASAAAAWGDRAAVAAPAAPGPRWRWPLDGVPVVLRPFLPPPQPWLPGHRGVDLAAPPGAVVRAAGAGTVTFAAPVAGRGVVVVRHVSPAGLEGSGDLRTTYEPVTATVRVGAVVQAGAALGRLAATGHHCATGCLHWGLRRGETYLDPLLLLTRFRVRLLPVWGAEAQGPNDATGRFGAGREREAAGGHTPPPAAAATARVQPGDRVGDRLPSPRQAAATLVLAASGAVLLRTRRAGADARAPTGTPRARLRSPQSSWLMKRPSRS